jgi:methyl-accepting chemotaxis protein
MRARFAKGALGALVGGAALGAASRVAASRHTRRPRVLGIPIPEELDPRNLELKRLTKAIDLKTDRLDLRDLARQIGNAAEQIEARSEDVRMLSAQAKRLSRKLS